MTAGFPPSVLWGVGDGKSWSTKDRRLVMAWQQYQNSLCGGCGHSRLLSSDPHYSGLWHAHDDEVFCLACGAVDRLERKREKAKARPKPGAKLQVEFHEHKIQYPEGGADV